jgi:Zn-dependent protease with chaperone function
MPRPVVRLLSSLPVLALYAATVLMETPVILARWLLALAASAVLMLVLHHPVVGSSGLDQLVLIPTAWSLLALITPFGGGWWWKQNLGGREPSERERVAYGDALELLRHHTLLPFREPSGWFVLDTPQPDAAVCGHTLMLSRGLLESEYLPAVLAHELGHLATSDGRFTAALNRLVIHPPPRTAERDESSQPHTVVLANDSFLLTVTLVGILLWLLRNTVVFAKGGLGLQLTAPFWGSYWREREYLADLHAARLGQAEELADFLEVHALIHDHPVPFVWLTEHTHPPTELRIDRLRKAGFLAGRVAPGAEPVKAAPAGPPAAEPDGPALTEPAPSADRHSGRQGAPCRPAIDRSRS